MTFTSLPIATKKVTELTSYTAPKAGDLVSIVDLAGNSTKKIDLITLNNYFSPSIEVRVYSQADFPAPVGSDITLVNGTTYVICATTILTASLVIPAGGNIQFVSAGLTKALVYVGTGTMFKAPSAFGIVLLREIIAQAPTGTLFDIAQVAGSWFSVSTIYANAVAGGTVKCATFTMFFSQFTAIGTGFTFENNSTQVSLSHSSLGSWRNVGTTMLTFKGNILDIALLDTRFTPASLDTVFDFQPSLESFGTNIVVGSTTGYTSGAGQIFTVPSLRQDYRKADISNSVGIPNSTISSQVAFTGNAILTDIITVNVKALINANWATQLQERMLLVDHCTFDQTSNTITARLVDNVTAFNHGLVNGNKIKFRSGGTLPPEILPNVVYFVISATATTFQISLTSGGSLVDFTTNGTGTHYLLHKEGFNRASWIMFDGITTEKIDIVGSVSAIGTLAADKVFFASIVKLDSNLVETSELDLFGKGSNATVDNLIAGASAISSLVSLAPQESLRLFVTNKTDATDLTIQDASLKFIKV
jgi:hypothetical protein